jgi:hypothetical protein
MAGGERGGRRPIALKLGEADRWLSSVIPMVIADGQPWVQRFGLVEIEVRVRRDLELPRPIPTE